MARSEVRRVLGFMAAPVVAAVLTFGLYLASARVGLPVIDAPETADFAIGLALSSLFVGVPLTVFGAIPLFVWMTSRGSLSLPRTLVAGATLGVSWYLFVVAMIPVVQGTLAVDIRRMVAHFEGFRVLALLLFLAAVGSGTAALFWWIAIRDTELDPKSSGYTQR